MSTGQAAARGSSTPPPLSPQLASLRRRYSDAALRSIPKLLQLVDRNLYSPTYGSFDRSYWHYRTMDFPCGMYQEFVLPLALVYQHPYPENPYFGKERVREIALAGVDFARRSGHPDGSCDDYFPYERALGAAVFSLYAMTESCLVLGGKRPEHLEFFARRGQWLLDHNESGQLANHQALAALALQNVFMLTDDARFARGRDNYVEIVKNWQRSEGWFQEYEGADPGYHSCSIAFLAKLMRKVEGGTIHETILKMLRPAVEFAWYFMHPDGSYAGEYGSRNTYHFYPHGFEVMAAHEPKAGQIADQFLHLALPRGSRYFNEDDRMCAHYVYDWLQSYLDFCPARPAPLNERADFTRWFPEARMLVRKTPRYYAVLSLAKGGVLKVASEDGPLYSDTGFIGRLDDGRVVVSHLVDEYKIEVNASSEPVTASAAGHFCERRVKLASPFKQVLFRLLNMTVGRVASDFLRRALQKVLITGKPRTELRFRRKFTFEEDKIEIEDEVIRPPTVPKLAALHLGSDATSIYVANSNVYQESVLLPWQDLSGLLPEINSLGHATYTHRATPFDDPKTSSKPK